MSLVSEFLRELIRSANDVEKFKPLERIQLIDRGISTIRQLRPPRSHKEIRRMDDIDRLESRAIRAATSCDDDARDRLLEIAAMIRDLHIVLEPKNAIQIEAGGGDG